MFITDADTASTSAAPAPSTTNELATRYRPRCGVPAPPVQLRSSAVHAFQLRETVQAARLTKATLGQGATGAFTETPDQMVRRVLRELGNKKSIVVINDEAHHCLARRPEADDDRLKGDDRKEAEKRDEEARIWLCPTTFFASTMATGQTTCCTW